MTIDGFEFDSPVFDIEINKPRKDGAPEGMRGFIVEPQVGFTKSQDLLLHTKNCSALSLDDPADDREQPIESEDE